MAWLLTFKAANKDVCIDNEKLCILLYAGDNVPSLLNILHCWCQYIGMIVNPLTILFMLGNSLFSELHLTSHVEMTIWSLLPRKPNLVLC